MNNEADDTHVRRPILALQWQCTYYHSSPDDIRHPDNRDVHHESSTSLSGNGVIYLGPVCYCFVDRTPLTLTIQHGLQVVNQLSNLPCES